MLCNTAHSTLALCVHIVSRRHSNVTRITAGTVSWIRNLRMVRVIKLCLHRSQLPLSKLSFLDATTRFRSPSCKSMLNLRSASMMSSHKSLRKATRQLKLISANSKVLLSLFLTAQNVTDETLLNCWYPFPPFPDIDDPGFPKDDDNLKQVMDFEQTWFSKFHDAIAFDSVQSLMEHMANVRIGCIPGR